MNPSPAASRPDTDNVALARRLLRIIGRVPDRAHEAPHLALVDVLERAASGEGELLAPMTGLAEAALTTPEYFAVLFDGLLDEQAKALDLVTSLNNLEFSTGMARARIERSRTMWLTDHGDWSGEGLLGGLLTHLETAPLRTAKPFEFLSVYYGFKDLLYSHLVEPSWAPIQREFFGHLGHQRKLWSRGYCNAYPYQGYGRIGVSGIKPTEERFRRYDIDGLLPAAGRALDIGSNCGFVAMHVAQRVAHVDAVELNPFLVLGGMGVRDRLGVNNVSFHQTDFLQFAPQERYDAVFSLANHCTIDGNLNTEFETYVAKLFSLTKPGGRLFFESHNVFGPGKGGPGDDGDMNQKFDVLERYFELERHRMVRRFVPAHDIDKLFVVLRRRPHEETVSRTFELETAIKAYDWVTPGGLRLP